MNKIIKFLNSVILIVCVLITLASCNNSQTDTASGATGDESNITEPSISTTTSDIADESETDEPGASTTTSDIADESETAELGTSTTTPTDDTTPKDEVQLDKTFALANPHTVLLDSKGVKLTALDFGEQTSESFVTIDVQIENNNDHDVNVMLNSLTVNGYLISGKIDSFITKAGANQVVPFTISKRDLEFAEIDEIREILVSFYAKDANYDLFISPTEPVSLKTTKFDTPVQELNTNGVQVYNDDNILIVIKEELSSDSRYMFAKLLIKNSTDSRISVSCSDFVVNGKAITNYSGVRYGNVPAGIISYNSIDILKSELEKHGIQEIETIEMTFKVSSADYTLIADNLTVTVNYK